ncbi:MAG TPA: hypothetical protein VLV88_06830 [Terriglobales bacterium]|nr:hypothetical protein [Terriglobales bacterium]
MAEDAIIRKLRKALGEPIDSEYKVVYILAESRKLLETYPPDPVPFALKLYCHWALHVNLENPATTTQFLEDVEAFADSILRGSLNIAAENKMFREFVFFDTFRNQFSQFLSSYGLPNDLCDNKARWHEFLTHYAGVIEDGSISCKAKTNRLKLVSEVEFNIGRDTRDLEHPHLPFGLMWDITLTDGKKLEVEVKASAPKGNEMILYGIRLH